MTAAGKRRVSAYVVLEKSRKKRASQLNSVNEGDDANPSHATTSNRRLSARRVVSYREPDSDSDFESTVGGGVENRSAQNSSALKHRNSDQSDFDDDSASNFSVSEGEESSESDLTELESSDGFISGGGENVKQSLALAVEVVNAESLEDNNNDVDANNDTDEFEDAVTVVRQRSSAANRRRQARRITSDTNATPRRQSRSLAAVGSRKKLSAKVTQLKNASFQLLSDRKLPIKTWLNGIQNWILTGMGWLKKISCVYDNCRNKINQVNWLM